MPSRPPEPTQEELEKYGKYESDRPGGVIFKDGKFITVKREPTEKEKREVQEELERRERKKRERRDRREKREKEEYEERASIPDSPPKPPKGPSWVETKVETLEKPPSALEDIRLDIEQYPGEPTFTERLHGVSREGVPAPKFIESMERLGIRYEEILGGPSALFRERAVRTLSKAEEAKLEGRDIEAGGLFSTYMLQRTLAGIWDIGTIRARPALLYQAMRTGVGLVVSPKVRKEVFEYAVGDPGGFTAELGGGLLGASLAESALRKVGLIKPASYRLKPTMKAREITSPATKMPTGKYPLATYDTKLWREGGTPILLHKEPELMTVYEPVPVYKPSLAEPALGLLSGLRPFTIPKEEPASKVRTEPSETAIPKGYLDVIQRTDQMSKPSVRGVTEEALILKPIAYTERRPRPLVSPRYTTTTITETVTRTRTRQREEQIQKQALAQAMTLGHIPRYREPTLSTKPHVPPRKKKKRERDILDLEAFGEIREYPIKHPEKLLKGLKI